MQSLSTPHFTFKEWFLATRPKTLTTAIVPFLAGTFLAWSQGFLIEWDLLIFAWLSAICIQIGTNFVNDAYDFRRGVDSKSSLGPERATRSGLLSGALSFDQVLKAGCGLFAVALLFGLPLIISGGWPVLIILILSIASGYAYTGGPYPLAYHGFGDVFVMLFYGFVSTGAAFWLQSRQISSESLFLSFQVGCLCTSMIAVNNLRDVFEDSRLGKNTLAVYGGVFFGRLEITVLLLAPLFLNVLWGKSLVQWLPLISSPIAAYIIYNIWTQRPSKEYNRFLALAGANMLLFCALLSLGFALT